ncbi:MAG: DNA-binding response regulator, partial [Gammaproteobacteria bacterium]|nr:DNA-binding response regulator [Gammaproteobacteria bacterium]
MLASALEASPGTKLIGMSAIENPTYLARAHAAGASDFLWEGMTAKQLVTAIEHAVAGKAPAGSGPFAAVVASLTAVELVGRPATHVGKSSMKLPNTPRELQVFRHIGYGLSNEEIARSLAISVETVK